jgi:hypothetical protein
VCTHSRTTSNAHRGLTHWWSLSNLLQALPAALAPNRTLDQDLCHLAPFSCDAQGHLTQLTLAGTGLDCGDAGLPDSLVKLQSVQLVDLAFNNIGGSFEKLAQVC